ncbi:hypothetical protein [Roseospirillum parvum]|uniref:Uncharacterized protein n=1 Tax=Roseospirillum parvum TaxID=83401 RepID=A0A1G8GJE0_9PROT|nr:hypothetical protein [Roseospirillum parvum]SDH94493.1 hypothetical protein SAMN05421742_1293 [Roseospirillum parvum]
MLDDPNLQLCQQLSDLKARVGEIYSLRLLRLNDDGCPESFVQLFLEDLRDLGAGATLDHPPLRPLVEDPKMGAALRRMAADGLEGCDLYPERFGFECQQAGAYGFLARVEVPIKVFGSDSDLCALSTHRDLVCGDEAWVYGDDIDGVARAAVKWARILEAEDKAGTQPGGPGADLKTWAEIEERGAP